MILDFGLSLGNNRVVASSLVTCKYCGQGFLKDNRHINENNKLGHNFYCSRKCELSYKNKQVELICENPSCQNKFKRKPTNISPRNFCSHSCAATVTNTIRIRPPQLTTRCSYCGEDKVRKGKKFCSFECFETWRKDYWDNYQPMHTRESVVIAIKDFVKQNSRLPVKKELNRFYSPARKYFGTWNKAVEVAGFTPNPVMFANHHTAKDGHICDSLAEKIIDDYLYERGITHERNIPYPEGGYTADFKIGNLWVEYFGLSGEHKRYDELKSLKRGIARNHNLTLVEIYPEDLYKENGLDKIFKGTLYPTKYYFGMYPYEDTRG